MPFENTPMNWSHGYNVSTGYTYGFYRELAPDWLNFGALLHGYHVPDAGAGFRYLDLGCGQGFGLCVLAAGYPQAEFLGIDFNPEHIGHARELARAAGLTNVRFEEADFSELARHWPEDYGRFEYVVLHGIYSWVPVPLRQAIVRNLDNATQPGGLVYVSYNTLPGWTSAIPLQHILRRLQQLQGGRSGAQIIEQGRSLLQGLVDGNAAVAEAMPPLKARLDSLGNQHPAYLVQEYLHENWHPMWVSQVADELAGAKLSYVGSATLPENYLPALLSPALAEIVRGGEGRLMQQELIDLAINQSFRRDLYCRGPRSTRNSMARLSEYVLHAHRLPPQGELQIPTSFGGLTVRAEFVDAIFQALGQGPKRIAELASLPVFEDMPLQEPIQVATLLLHAGYASLGGAQQPGDSVGAFNAVVAPRVAQEHAPYGCLAARHTPTGVSAGDTDMILYGILRSDQDAAADVHRLAARLLDEVLASGRQLLRDGKVLKIPDERFHRAAQIVDDFVGSTLPKWRRLGVL